MWVSPSIQSAEQVWLQEKWSKYVEEKMWSAESLFINSLDCYGRIQMRGQELLVLNGDFFVLLTVAQTRMWMLHTSVMYSVESIPSCILHQISIYTHNI